MAEIDSLEIKLKSNAQDVAKGFDTLTHSIKNTSQSMNGMKADELDKTAKAIKSLNRSSSTDKLEKGLENISRAINNFASNLKTIDTTKLDNIADKIDKISQVGARKLQSTVRAIEQMSSSLTPTSFQFNENAIAQHQENIYKMLLTDEEYAKKRDEILSKMPKIEMDFESDEEYRKRVAEIFSNIPKVNINTDEAKLKVDEVTEKVKQSTEKIKDSFEGVRLDFNPSQLNGAEAYTAEYISLQREIKNTEAELEKYLDKQERYEELDLDKEGRQFQNITKNIEETDKKLQQLYADMQRLQSSGGATFNVSDRLQQSKLFVPSQKGDNQRYTKAYTTLEKQIQKAEQRLNDLLQKQRTFSEEGNIAPTRFKNLELSIKEADGKLQALNNDMRRLQVSGADIENVSPYENLSQKMSGVQGVTQNLAKALRGMGAGGAASGIQKLSSNIGALSKGLGESAVAAEGATGAMAGMSTAIPVIGIILAAVTVLVKAFTSLAKAVVNAFKKIVSAIQNIVGHIKTLVTNILSIGTSSYQAQTVVGKFINKMVNMFKSRLLRQAVTQAIQYMKEGFKELDAYSQSIGSPFHSNVAMLVADLRYLGRSIAAAFEPIINVAAPILDFLIKKIVTVINYINQFFAALSGKSTWTKATYGAEGYGEAASGAAKSQKDLNKAIREWDKLNVITDPNKGSGGGGGGSSSGGGDAFTTEDVESPISDLAKKIKDTWETTADFTWLGNDIGQKVKDTLDGIPWEEKIKPAAAKFGKALATLINGFVETPGLDETIGKTIAEAINTVFTGFEAFAEYIHGDSIGTFIGNLVKSALSNIEWDKYITGMGNLGRELAKGINALANTDVLSEISKSFAKVLKGGIEGAYQFVTNLDFKNLGTKVGTAISDFFKEMNKVDTSGMSGWAKAATTVSEFAKGVMDMISNALDSIDWNAVGTSIRDFLTNIDWVGLLTSAANLKSKISGAMWNLFVEAIKTMGAISVDITFDLLAKVQEKWNEAKQWLTDKAINIVMSTPDIVAKVKEKWEAFKTWWADKKANLSIGVTNIKDKVKEKWDSFKEWLGNKFSMSITISVTNIKQKVKDAYNTFLNWWNKLKSKTLKIKMPHFSLSTKKQSTSSTIGKLWNSLFGGKPQITVSYYAQGGFPTKGSLFVAGERGAEMVANTGNGNSEILNKSQIADAMARSMVMANAEQNALLRQQNELLTQILQKETGINYKDIFKATQKGAREYTQMTGNYAF